MSIIQFLNGALRDDKDDEEVVARFIREQGGSVAEPTRLRIASAFEAQLLGDFQQAELEYRKVLRSVGHSEVVWEQLDKIHRRTESRE